MQVTVLCQSEATTQPFPVVKRKRGRPRKHPILPTQVINIDADSNDVEASQPEPITKEFTPETDITPPVTRPSLEALLTSPMKPLISQGAAPMISILRSSPSERADGAQSMGREPHAQQIVTQADPQSGEVTLSIPNNDNVTSTEYISAIINLDDIDIIQKDNTEGKRCSFH